MKQIILLFAISLFYCSCDKQEEVTYRYFTDLQGDQDTYFANEGEIRKFTLSIYRISQIKGVDTDQKEKVKISAITKIQLLGEQFTLLNMEKEDYIYSFEIKAKGNNEDTIPKSRLLLDITDNHIKTTNEYNFQQKESLVTYNNTITSEIKQPLNIPSEGGYFEIPFNSHREKIVNGKRIEIQPVSLVGLRYVISRTNSALVHSISIKKDSEVIGKYKLVIESKGFYNLTNWGIKNNGKVFIEINDENKSILYLDIIQPQTEGEEYSVPLVSTTDIGTFNI